MDMDLATTMAFSSFISYYRILGIATAHGMTTFKVLATLVLLPKESQHPCTKCTTLKFTNIT